MHFSRLDAGFGDRLRVMDTQTNDHRLRVCWQLGQADSIVNAPVTITLKQSGIDQPAPELNVISLQACQGTIQNCF
jgi:hypothetical protein